MIAAAAIAGAIIAVSMTPVSASTVKPSGSITVAEGPGAAPNYIFPYASCSYFSVSNLNQFQMLMYRPVYWFGLGANSAVQYPLSTANAPVFSNGNKTVTINMKGWKFSDGSSVDAESVMFFLNMYKADPSDYCGYNPGYGIPDQVSSVRGSGNTVTINFSSAVNPNWILYNYLSELTPMPSAWDRTSASAAGGSGGCASGVWGAPSTDAACKAVYHFLDSSAQVSSNWTNSMWQVVDGPWKLSKADVLGNVTFVPNTSYDGPQKAQLAQVSLKAYTTTQAEENDLYAGSIDMGYVDPTALPGPAKSATQAGPNVPALASKYNLVTGTSWAFNYAVFNFSSTDPMAAVLKQLYIRQALFEAVDQSSIIKNVDKGYGSTTCSPLPPNTPASVSGPVPCPYKASITAAKALLTTHGWTVKNGVETCTRPGTASNDCGAGIPEGKTLNFAIVWASGSPSLDATFQAEISDWTSIGINFSHSTDTYNNVVADCSNGGTFEICSWGGGWVYAPDYYPSGETLFTPQGGFNPGGYSDPTMTSLINQTTFGTAPLTAYETYAAQQLPVLFEPQANGTGEVSKALKGVLPPDPLQNFMPEYLHF
jgi:peptide/nickel transport system substrate-binding protein